MFRIKVLQAMPIRMLMSKWFRNIDLSTSKAKSSMKRKISKHMVDFNNINQAELAVISITQIITSYQEINLKVFIHLTSRIIPCLIQIKLSWKINQTVPTSSLTSIIQILIYSWMIQQWWLKDLIIMESINLNLNTKSNISNLRINSKW